MVTIDRMRGRIRDERGAVIAVVAICLTVLLGICGLALDAGRGYLARAELARAVDAGALAGARALRQGQPAARQRALDMAALNGLVDGSNGVDLTVSFGTNEFGERTIGVEARRHFRTLLMGVLGIDSMTVASAARAAIPPVDLILVLDQSGSLERNDAWDDLQDAAKDFVEFFDDDIDQMALVSFQLRGTNRFSLAGGFSNPVRNRIDAMQSDGDTNAGEGLRLAHVQLISPAARDRSAKVVVFFTDGRNTAFRGNIAGEDRMMAVFTTQAGHVRGYFNRPDDLPSDHAATPNGCNRAPVCLGWSEDQVRDEAREIGLVRADQLRSEGFYIYSIGLGDPDADDELEVPDLDYLREIANEDGAADGGQPEGKAYFAPSGAELRAVFNQVAQDLLVRLAQ